MDWKPSNEPARYDKARAAQVEPISTEIQELGLPLLRFRKLNGILGALTMQIEDGGDSPQVNRLLLEALREGVRHQVGERRAQPVLGAIDTFERAEAQRWAMVQAGTLPPVQLAPEEQLDELIHAGYSLLEANQRTAACDKWLEAWEWVKKLATPETRTSRSCDSLFPGLFPPVSNWCADLEMELGNAGLDDAVYHEHRVRYVREFLARFPDEAKQDADRYVSFKRAEGEALWRLGRQAEAEAMFQALVEELPHKAWGYIGWSDEYYLWRDAPADYEAAEAILLRALKNPQLDDREWVLDRLVGLYEKSDRPDQAVPYATERDAIRAQHKIGRTPATQAEQKPTAPAPKAKRSSRRKRRTRGRKKRRR